MMTPEFQGQIADWLKGADLWEVILRKSGSCLDTEECNANETLCLRTKFPEVDLDQGRM